jgi:hypothetical protein
MSREQTERVRHALTIPKKETIIKLVAKATMFKTDLRLVKCNGLANSN